MKRFIVNRLKEDQSDIFKKKKPTNNITGNYESCYDVKNQMDNATKGKNVINLPENK